MTGRRGFLGLLLAAPVIVREAFRQRRPSLADRPATQEEIEAFIAWLDSVAARRRPVGVVTKVNDGTCWVRIGSSAKQSLT